MSAFTGLPRALFLGRRDSPLTQRISGAARRAGLSLEFIPSEDLVTLRENAPLSELKWLQGKIPKVIFCDATDSGISPLRSKSLIEKITPTVSNQIEWIAIVGSQNKEQQIRFAYSGILESIVPTALENEISAALDRCEARSADPRRHLADLVHLISGVKLDESKNLLIEKRLTRRMVELGLKSVQDYMTWFHSNRNREIPEILAQLTTHTTEFFRDTSHFDSLVDQQLPLWIRNSPSARIRIWSAACSTGEEVYSIAMTLMEGFRALGLNHPDFEILGTDIDANSIKVAQKGIYPASSVLKIAKPIRDRYFDEGIGELKGLFKIKDTLWNHCKFRIQNLNSETWPEGPFHAIFVRNVFIYFKKDEVHRICKRMGELLIPAGRLHIGYSESIERDATGMVNLGKSIYAHESQLKNGITPASSIPMETKPHSPRPVVQALSPLQPSPSGRDRPCRVLIVDDSATLRASLKKILTPQTGFVIVGEATHPLEAVELLKTREVDIMTLDLHMPKMDGIEYLERIQGESHPPVVVISSVNREEAVEVLKCLELGASDYIEKPQGLSLEDNAESIRKTLQAVISGKHRAPLGRKSSAGSGPTIGPGIQWSPSSQFQDLIILGASTGGIEAIRSVVARLPAETPPIVIVQHIPKLFSALFANRLNDISRVKCLEAADGMEMQPNHLYIAPGGKHLAIRRGHQGLVAETNQSPALHGCRPAVDYLFNSVATLLSPAGANRSSSKKLRVTAALLTGMGRDGAQGMKLLHERGVTTVVQDEDTCIVYGMPKAAMELEAVDFCVPLNSVAWHLFAGFSDAEIRKKKKRAA